MLCSWRKAQLRRLFGARRDMVDEMITFQLDRNNALAGQHRLARQAQFSPGNLGTYPEDGSIPQAIQNALIPVLDPANSIAKSRSTPAKGNREPEVSADMEDENDDGGAEEVAVPFVIETAAVMPTGSDLAVSSAAKSRRYHKSRGKSSIVSRQRIRKRRRYGCSPSCRARWASLNPGYGPSNGDTAYIVPSTFPFGISQYIDYKSMQDSSLYRPAPTFVRNSIEDSYPTSAIGPQQLLLHLPSASSSHFLTVQACCATGRIFLPIIYHTTKKPRREQCTA